MQINYESLARQTRARMVQEHQLHIQAHCRAYGAPLGVLKTQPTQRQLDEAFVEFRAEQMVKTGEQVTERKTKQQALAAARRLNDAHAKAKRDEFNKKGKS